MPEIIQLKSISVPELDIYARLNETQLLHYFEPEKGIFIAESPTVIEVALQGGCEPISVLTDERLVDSGDVERLIKNHPSLPVYTASRDTLTALTGFELTRGALCAMLRPTPKSAEEVTRGARRIAVLEEIADSTNVGAIFRSAAALDIDAVLITPTTCDPLSRRALRVSMGTVMQVPWTKICDTPADWAENGVEELRKLGFKTAAMALSDNSVSIDDEALGKEERLAIILGSEGNGLLKKTIEDCDYTVKIPMSHGVDSLNVAAASAVAFWQLRRK
jgi:tRNA G18 (ribose-2'-O)-methylase SpoU